MLIAGIRSIVQKENASLAIQLASTWISRYSANKSSGILNSTENKQKIDNIKSCISKKYIVDNKDKCKKSTLCFEKVSAALESCTWPGRTQILLGKTMDFYIDGAHTEESMECCVNWFQDIVQSSRFDMLFLKLM